MFSSVPNFVQPSTSSWTHPEPSTCVFKTNCTFFHPFSSIFKYFQYFLNIFLPFSILYNLFRTLLHTFTIINCSKHPPPLFSTSPYIFGHFYLSYHFFLTIFTVLESFNTFPRVLDHCQLSLSSTACSQVPYHVFELLDPPTASTHLFNSLFTFSTSTVVKNTCKHVVNCSQVLRRALTRLSSLKAIFEPTHPFLKIFACFYYFLPLSVKF